MEIVAALHLNNFLSTKSGQGQLKVRLVTGRLSSGQLEVLATARRDEVACPTEERAAVYWRCWGHETYYGRLKGRLDLEHGRGQTVAAVEQDFHATVLLANVDSVVTGPAQSALSARPAGRRVCRPSSTGCSTC